MLFLPVRIPCVGIFAKQPLSVNSFERFVFIRESECQNPCRSSSIFEGILSDPTVSVVMEIHYVDSARQNCWTKQRHRLRQICSQPELPWQPKSYSSLGMISDQRSGANSRCSRQRETISKPLAILGSAYTNAFE